MIERMLEYFDAEKIMNSGQIFRMYKVENGVYQVFSGDRCLQLGQQGAKVTFYCTEEEFEEYWEHYFDLDRDYGELVQSVLSVSEKDNVFLKNACHFGAGIRVLNQNIWEMMISFIISQQKQIPSIRKCIEALCERFGERVCLPEGYSSAVAREGFYYTFPTAEKIVAAGPWGIKGLSLGYRERYIYETAGAYMTGGLSDWEVKHMGFEAAKKYLCSFCGIGEKVANCICLFGAGYVDAFPIDVHIKQILYREYGDKSVPFEKLKQSDFEQLIEDNFGRFAGFKGIVQQWIFAYELVR